LGLGGMVTVVCDRVHTATVNCKPFTVNDKPTDRAGLGSTVEIPEGKVIGFEGDVRDYFCDYLENDIGFVQDGDSSHEEALRREVADYNTSVGYQLRGFTASELARRLTNMAVADGEIAPEGTLANAKYLTAMTKTCNKVPLFCGFRASGFGFSGGRRRKREGRGGMGGAEE
jgi:hypothetical protein